MTNDSAQSNSSGNACEVRNGRVQETEKNILMFYLPLEEESWKKILYSNLRGELFKLKGGNKKRINCLQVACNCWVWHEAIAPFLLKEVCFTTGTTKWMQCKRSSKGRCDYSREKNPTCDTSTLVTSWITFIFSIVLASVPTPFSSLERRSTSVSNQAIEKR